MVNLQILEEAALAMTLCDPDKPVNDGSGRLSVFRAMDAQDSLHRLLVTADDWQVFREKFPEAAAIYDKTKDRFRSMFRAFTQE